MTRQEQYFLINYLGDRAVSWSIDTPVRERYPNLHEDIGFLIANGYISIYTNQYKLTEIGESVRAEFRAEERTRKKAMHEAVLSKAMLSDFIGAYNARAEYERNSVIPHGIFVGINSGANAAWTNTNDMPFSVKNNIENSYKLDFSDCQNSSVFKDSLRRFYVGLKITGSNQIEIPENFETVQGERLVCPTLDLQLSRKCVFLNPPKLRIYFNTKVAVFNCISTRTIKEWDGNFSLGMYDCTNGLNFSMAEFEYYSTLGIAGFPKTFQTYYKHKQKNSDKYRTWLESIGNRRLTMPKI